MLPKIVRESC